MKKLSNVKKNKTKNFKKKTNYNFDISKIDNQYSVGYDYEKKRVIVDIIDNKIFSYYDDDENLIKKMRNLIDQENYEDAGVLYKYLKTCGIAYP